MESRKIDVSVIVTVYNIKKYLRECLDSILSQNEINLECICVDDASTDRSIDILEEYAKKDLRIKIIQNHENVGLSSTRNVGFMNARGEYLYNIDGDDFLVPGALKRLYSCAKDNALDLLGFSATSFFDKEEMRKYGEEDEYVRNGEYQTVKLGAELFADLIENNDRASSNMVLYFYRRDYFEKNNLYGVEGLRYADDSMFAMYMSAKRAMCIPDRLYMRRYREGSICTAPMKKYYLESMVVLFFEELRIWNKIDCSSRVSIQIEKYFNMRLQAIRGFYDEFKDDNSDMPLLDKNMAVKYFYKYFIERKSLYQVFLTADTMHCVKSAGTVILYGAGFIANEVAQLLENYDVKNYKVAVTSKGSGEEKTFRGKRIYNIRELESERNQAVVIVAMSRVNYKAVMNVLGKLGFEKIQWMSF